MSALTEELDKDTIRSWRQFAQTVAFQKGLDWLRHNRKRPTGPTDADMVKSAHGWHGYMDAVDDVQDKLTKFPEREQSLDEDPLHKN